MLLQPNKVTMFFMDHVPAALTKEMVEPAFQRFAERDGVRGYVRVEGLSVDRSPFEMGGPRQSLLSFSLVGNDLSKFDHARQGISDVVESLTNLTA